LTVSVGWDLSCGRWTTTIFLQGLKAAGLVAPSAIERLDQP
jgi:hypothetical protein